MNISTVAKYTNLSTKMIRYYEEIGLIPPPQRNAAGYRIYHSHDLQRLNFIYNARQLGFSVDAIKTLLILWQDENRHSADVKLIAQQHVDDLNMKIQQMQTMVNQLEGLIRACSGNSDQYCSILAQMEFSLNPQYLHDQATDKIR